MTSPIPGPTAFRLTPQGPFDLMNQNEFFGGWPVAGANGIVLTFPVEGWAGSASVVLRQEDDSTVNGAVYAPDQADIAWQQALAVLSLNVDGTTWPDVGERDPVVGRLQHEYRYLRPVLFHSPYEAAAAFVIGHRISITQGRALRSRMAEQLGDAVSVDGTPFHAFPRPEQLRRLTSFAGLGEEKIRRLHSVADAAQDGWLRRSVLLGLPADQALARIRSIRGIGDFFAQGILTRGAGVQDWLSDDPITEKAIASAYQSSATTRTVEEVSDLWRPFRMWSCVILHVWARSTNLSSGSRHQRKEV